MLQPDPTSAGPALGLRRRSAPAVVQVREIAHAGLGRSNLIPLWFGEPDTPTPKFICDAAARALAAGDTFYQPNAGIHELRAALAEYMNGLYGERLTPEDMIVSASAMNALMLVMQALVDPGDMVVTTTPSWPNLPALPQILSGRVRTCRSPPAIRLAPRSGSAVRRLRRPHPGDLSELPNNPTGWMMSAEQQRRCWRSRAGAASGS